MVFNFIVFHPKQESTITPKIAFLLGAQFVPDQSPEWNNKKHIKPYQSLNKTNSRLAQKFDTSDEYDDEEVR